MKPVAAIKTLEIALDESFESTYQKEEMNIKLDEDISTEANLNYIGKNFKM